MQLLWRTVWRVFKKTNNRVAIWSSNPIPKHITKQNYNLKRSMHPDVPSSTIRNSLDIETAQIFISRWMDKEDVVHIYNGILFNHKKEQNNVTCSHMDGPRDYHTKWSKSDRERQILYDITCMWYLKNNTKEKRTHRHRNQTYS